MKNIPVLFVEGRTLAEAYEKALVALYREGVRVSTQYDKAGAVETAAAATVISRSAAARERRGMPWAPPPAPVEAAAPVSNVAG